MNPLPHRGRGPSHPIFVLALLCACDQRPREISEVRTGPAPPVERASSAARFGFEDQPRHDHGAADSQAQYHWQLPAGWEALPPTPMRAASFTVASAPEIDCSLTVLPAGGGGLESNLNRWRRQMSLADLAPQELRALPSLPVLGQAAVLLECDGVYRGMGNEVARPDSRLLGIALQHEGKAVFVKMVGPVAAVQRERANFEALCRSLHPAADGAHAGVDHDDPAVASPDAAALSWDAPAGWSRVGSSPMRLVTFALGRNGDTECYVAVLSGSAGGLAANVNRWRQQMAQPELSAPEIAALEVIPMLGTQGRLVRIRGDFTGMDGAAKSGAMMLGAICELQDQAVFVKMVGPAADVAAEEGRFAAFCRSLR
jgi:hypothetical protein